MKIKIAQIIPLTRLKRDLHYFDYQVPEELIGKIKRGQLVEIPFRNKNIKGIVFDFVTNPEKKIRLKKIKTIIDPLPFLFKWQLDLIEFLSEYYFVSMSVFVKMIVPEIPKRQRASRDKFLLGIDFRPGLGMNKNITQYLKNNKPVFLRYYSFEDKMKTYSGLIDNLLKKQKQILIIVPQLNDIKKIYQYLEKYQDQVTVFLNDLPKNKYFNEWLRIKKAEAKIIIGTRSAIFAPVKNLGLVIIDQEDNPSHKQEEPNPRYQVKKVALQLQKLTKANLIFSSSSPALTSLYQIQQKNWQYFEINRPQVSPIIKLIDRQDEFRRKNFSIFSEELISQLDYNLKRAQKVFLFLNRKGMATLASCQDCGYVANCPTCQLPLTLHSNKKLICHHCQFEQDLFLTCPHCRGTNIKLTGTGTDKVEAEIRNMYPQAKVLSIDQQTSFNQYMLENQDIIIGTQYAFDFIDWQSIELIGVVNADTLLYLPDYRAAEKTFNLLIKLASFITNDKKQLLVQTFSPDNYIFQAIKNLDYKTFYLNEIKERQLLKYPPFSLLLRLIYQSIEFNAGQIEINKVYQNLKSKIQSDKILISTPQLAYTQQVRGRWRWQIVIKVLSEDMDLDFLDDLPENIIIDREPESLL